LLSATGPDGVTSYAYNPATGSVNDNALTSITNPDGTQQFFTYNAQGWLASQSGAGGSGQETYTYPSSGEVTVTNALGGPTKLMYGATGEIAQTQDALGNVTQLQYDSAGDLTGVVTPGNSTSSYSYNSAGDLTGSSDPLGGSIGATYASGTQNLTSFTNQLGSQIHYTYDSAGNVTGIIYQNGSDDTYDYNTSGLLTASSDADGNTVAYNYNSTGNLTKEAFGNGTTNTYTYDSSGNLLSAVAANGTSESFTYNSARFTRRTGVPRGQSERSPRRTQGRPRPSTEMGQRPASNLPDDWAFRRHRRPRHASVVESFVTRVKCQLHYMRQAACGLPSRTTGEDFADYHIRWENGFG
jgi:YD repeat-containing protein